MEQRAIRILESLNAKHNLRKLRTVVSHGQMIEVEGRPYVNMSSNSYLGLSGDLQLQDEFLSTIDRTQFLMSNPSSRLMTGNSEHYNLLERSIERLFLGRRALVLGSGYAVNSGVLPALTSKNDLIIADKLSHASLIDGLRLCEAKWMRFNHNDLTHLESLLQKHRRDYDNVWVVTESVFSMDGDTAPIAELVALKERYDLRLYIDEAHSFGVFGESGAGYAAMCGVDDRCDIIIATLGKAMASAGAFVICGAATRELLVNRMRTLIYTTALPPINLMWSKFLIDRLPDFGQQRTALRRLVKLMEPINNSGSQSQILPILTYDNLTTERTAQRMRDAGFWVTPIRTPTVPAGKARIRVSLSADIDPEHVKQFVELCKNIG